MCKTIKYRSFRNGDVPGITHVWNAVESPDYMKITSNFNEVASSLLFDPSDLFVAVEIDKSLPPNPACEGRIVGFIHGGYGPKSDNMTPDRSVGTIAMLRVEPRADRNEIGQNLLTTMEQHFISHGAKKIYAGAVYPHAPFYISLLSTGELHGIIHSSTFSIDLLKKNQYQVDSTYELYRIDISGGIPVAGDKLFMASNQYIVKNNIKKMGNWWRLAAFQSIVRRVFTIMESEDVGELGSATSHLFNPTIRSPEEDEVVKKNMEIGTRSIFATIHDLYIQPEYRNKTLGQALVYAILWNLQKDKCKFVDLQVPVNNPPARAIFDRLKFSHFADSSVFCKVLD